MLKARVPEGKAIINGPEFTTNEYSDYMKKYRSKEYLKFVDNLLERVNLSLGSKVLEIGPGPSWITDFLCEKRLDIFVDALELSQDMIKTAQKMVRTLNLESQIHYFQGNVENMTKLPLNSYDLVYSNDSLHHWDNLDDAFSEINRVLKPQGSLYIHDSKRNLNLSGKIILNLLGKIFAGKMWKYWKSSINASYTVQELREMISKGLNYSWVVSEDLMDLFISY